MQRGQPDHTVRPVIKRYQWFIAAAGTLILIIIIAAVVQGNDSVGMWQEDGDQTDKTAKQADAAGGLIAYGADEETSEAAIQLGKEKLKEEQYDAALWYFNEAMGSGEVRNEELYNLMSDAFLGKGNIGKAVEVLDIGVRETYRSTLMSRRDYILANTHMVKKSEYQDGVLLQYEEYDEKGDIQKREYYSESGDRGEWESFEYWEGKLSYEERHYPDGKTKWRREYDEREREAFYYEYDEQENLTVYSVVDSYTETGKPKSRICYDGRGNFQWSRNYEYDEYDNCVKDMSYNDDGSLSSWQEYGYDENVNLIRTAGYYANGEFIASIEWEYDEHNNITKESHYNSDGSYEWGSLYGYEYDRMGNPVKKTQYNDASDVAAQWEYKYEYMLMSDDISYADTYPSEAEEGTEE